MSERGADGDDSSVYFLFGCSDKPSIYGSRGLNCIRFGVEINRGQYRVDKRAEASPAWPFEVPALDHLDLNSGAAPIVEIFRASECGDRLNGDRRLRGPFE